MEGRATDLRKENGLRVGEEESELAWLHVPHLGKLAEPMTVIHRGTGFRRCVCLEEERQAAAYMGLELRRPGLREAWTGTLL